MATRTVVCPDCDEPLIYGRLSCARCGTLLASVAGARRRRPLRTVTVEEPASLTEDADDLTSAADADGAEGEAAAAHAGAEPAASEPAWTRAEPTDLQDQLAEPEAASPEEPEGRFEPAAEPVTAAEALMPADHEEPMEHEVPVEREAVAEAAPTEPSARPQDEATAEPDETAGMGPDVGAATEPVPDRESRPDVEPVAFPDAPDDEPPAAPPAAGDTEPAAPDGAGVAPGDVDDAAEPPPPAVDRMAPSSLTQPDLEWLEAPAAVLKPSFTGRSRLDLAARPDDPADGDMDAGVAAATAPPAGAWVPPSIDPEAEARADLAAVPAPAASPATSTRPAAADAAVPARNDVVSWLVALGSGLATLGFLLPWSRVIPFSGGLGGYTDRWGLAIPSHALVLVAAAVLLGFAMVPNKLPAWIRNGVLPLGLGGLVTGLVWPYVLGGFGFDLGSLVTAVAGVVLVAGGVLGLHGTRHHSASPAV